MNCSNCKLPINNEVPTKVGSYLLHDACYLRLENRVVIDLARSLCKYDDNDVEEVIVSVLEEYQRY